MKVTPSLAGRYLVSVWIALCAAPGANAGFIGQTVSADYHFPSLGTVSYTSIPSTAVVGPGVEFPDVGQFGIGASPAVDVSDTQFLITYPAGWELSSDPKTFDGWVIFDVFGAIPAIIGASLAGTNIPGYDGSQITFDADHVYVNQLGFAEFAAQSFISVDVRFASGVPEPSSLALIGAAMAVLGLVRRRRVAIR